MTEKEPVLYRFTPHSDGAFIKTIPQHDLTASDVARLSRSFPADWRDAITPHPGYGAPLYTATADGEAAEAAFLNDAADHDARVEAEARANLAEQPKWYRDKLDKAHTDGVEIPPRIDGETQRDYEARVFALDAERAAIESANAQAIVEAAVNGPNEQDGDA